MATYDNLPVYKTSYDLLLQIFEIIKKFEKQYKYTLWDKIKNEIIDLITSIYRANSNFEERLKNIKKIFCIFSSNKYTLSAFLLGRIFWHFYGEFSSVG